MGVTRRWWALALGVAVALLWGGVAYAQSRVALVMGNGAYTESARLPNPVRDAKAVSAAFKRLGFTVVEGFDLGLQDTIRKLQSFGELASRADLVVIYYAGHGIQVGGRNYLIPVDAKLKREQDVQYETVSVDQVLAEARSARRLKLVILDACRDNPFGKQLARSMGASRSALVGRGFARVDDVESDTLIAYATKADDIAADDGGGNHSPYTAALLQHMEVEGLPVERLFGRVRDEVLRSTGGRQQPFVYGSLGGDAVYLKPPGGSAPTAAAPSIDPDVAACNALGSSRNRNDFDAYLRRYPNGMCAGFARVKLAELDQANKPAATPVPPAPEPPVVVATAPVPTPTTRQPLTIGAAGPMSGPYAQFGEQMRKGVELAVDDINAAGGILGQRLKLEIADDQCDPRQAVAAANRLARSGAKAVIGHFCSGSSIPASQVYAEERIVQISPASTNPKLTEQGLSNVFRVVGRDDSQGVMAGELIATQFRNRRVAIFHDRSAYGQGLATTTQRTLAGFGMRNVLFDSYTAGQKNYDDVVGKLANVDVVYFGGYHTEIGLIAKQMRARGVTAQIVSGDALVTDEYWSIAGSAGNGTLMSFGPDARTFREAQTTVAKFRRAGYEPEGYALYAYAALQAYAEAARNAGSTDSSRVADALRRQPVSTVLGRIGFDAKGDLTTPAYVWYQWNNGRYAVVK